jgi:hypothetical protein
MSSLHPFWTCAYLRGYAYHQHCSRPTSKLVRRNYFNYFPFYYKKTLDKTQMSRVLQVSVNRGTQIPAANFRNAWLDLPFLQAGKFSEK